MILHPSLGSHIEHIVGKIHAINQYSNRTAHLIVINHVNNTGCYVECLSHVSDILYKYKESFIDTVVNNYTHIVEEL